jgi:hypothetical protein
VIDGRELFALPRACALSRVSVLCNIAMNDAAKCSARGGRLHGKADSQSADVTGKARSGDTPNESGSVAVSPSQDGSPPTDVPSGSVGEEHGDSDESSSRELETTR